VNLNPAGAARQGSEARHAAAAAGRSRQRYAGTGDDAADVHVLRTSRPGAPIPSRPKARGGAIPIEADVQAPRSLLDTPDVVNPMLKLLER
jgi:hypothetical protein